MSLCALSPLQTAPIHPYFHEIHARVEKRVDRDQHAGYGVVQGSIEQPQSDRKNARDETHAHYKEEKRFSLHAIIVVRSGQVAARWLAGVVTRFTTVFVFRFSVALGSREQVTGDDHVDEKDERSCEKEDAPE